MFDKDEALQIVHKALCESTDLRISHSDDNPEIHLNEESLKTGNNHITLVTLALNELPQAWAIELREIVYDADAE